MRYPVMKDFVLFLSLKKNLAARLLVGLIVLLVLIMMTSCQGCSHSGRRAMAQERNVNDVVLLDYNQAYVQTEQGEIKLAYCDYCEQFLKRMYKNQKPEGKSLRYEWEHGRGIPVFMVENNYMLDDTLDYSGVYILSFEHGEERTVKLWDDRPDTDTYFNGYLIGFKMKE